eukprot:CAMPEP_0184862526 /NCGR_PEP_ID=MMETSP0580-20130426/6992_1 /TAXON_ID=1118495 /ORGANISM="Dactyliosolen fragilissimus" /LENGTH=165 /DNA_ID=CAMNT_0027360447 /DNA_START=69 /DNA_END=566 /DNA_ORIENTATION=-
MAQLSIEYDEMVRNCENLEDQITYLDSENIVLEERINDLKSDRKKTQFDIDNITDTVKTIKMEKLMTKSENDQLEMFNEMTDNMILKLQAHEMELEKETEEENLMSGQLEKEEKTLTTQLQKIKQENEDFSKFLSEAVTKRNSEIERQEEIMNENKELRDAVSAL